MRPLRHAVCLVDADEGDGRQLAQQGGQAVRAARDDRLGRDEQDARLAGRQRRHHLLAHRFRLVRVQTGRLDERRQSGDLCVAIEKRRLDFALGFRSTQNHSWLILY